MFTNLILAAALCITPNTVIDISDPAIPPATKAVFRRSFSCLKFDWGPILPLVGQRIPITVSDFPLAARTYPTKPYPIEFDDNYLENYDTGSALRHELGHVTQFAYIDPNHLWDELEEIMGHPVEGEEWVSLWAQSYGCPLSITYPLTDLQAQKIRGLFLTR